jgi:hypothetical protein
MIGGCSVAQAEATTPKMLSSLWGKAKIDTTTGRERTIVYDQKLAWRGLVIFVLVPIPLLLPIGHDQAKFMFQDQHLVHVEYTDNGLDAAVCGYHSEGPNSVGCIAYWH